MVSSDEPHYFNQLHRLPIIGIIAAVGFLTIATYRYSGDAHWSRVTVSMLCAAELPNGAPNSGRGLPVAALLLLCASMALLFELVSWTANTRGMRKTIQIAGIGSMVYALLTATPMHNLMVNVALAFFLVANTAIILLLYRTQRYELAIAGIFCILLKLGSVSMYYTDAYVEIWGIMQKVSFSLTTIWLFAVLLLTKSKANFPAADVKGTPSPSQESK